MKNTNEVLQWERERAEIWIWNEWIQIVVGKSLIHQGHVVDLEFWEKEIV